MRLRHVSSSLGLAVLALAWASVANAGPPYVTDFDTFLTHTESHIERVKRLGIELYRRYPVAFSHVDEKTLTQYLSLHDRSKTLGAFSKNSIASRLYRYYGKDLKVMSAADQQEFQKLIDALNESDAQVSKEFFGRHRLLNAEGEFTSGALEMMKIEKIADMVDRAQSPVSIEEFGKQMTPASEWLSNPLESRMASSIERGSVYNKLVAGATFEEHLARQQSYTCIQRRMRFARGTTPLPFDVDTGLLPKVEIEP